MGLGVVETADDEVRTAVTVVPLPVGGVAALRLWGQIVHIFIVEQSNLVSIVALGC